MADDRAVIAALRHERKILYRAALSTLEALDAAAAGPAPPYSVEFAAGWAGAVAYFDGVARAGLEAATARARWDAALTRVELLEALSEDAQALVEASTFETDGRLRRAVRERLDQLGAERKQTV